MANQSIDHVIECNKVKYNFKYFKKLRTLDLIKFKRIKWKWKSQLGISLILLGILPFVMLFSSCNSAVISDINISSTHINQRQPLRNTSQRLQEVWNGLSRTEKVQIFGQTDFIDSPTPPTFLDLVTPENEGQAKRKQRSVIINSSEQATSEVKVKLKALGRSFRLRLQPNLNLVNLNGFVHLFRQGNESQILSDQIIKRYLHCFTHGSVSSHYSTLSGTHSEREVTRGRAAMDVCNHGGLTGFIAPIVGGDEEDPEGIHYVIHPIPQRFHNRQSSWTNDTNPLPEHFIWERQKTDTHKRHFLFNVARSHQNQEKRRRRRRSHYYDSSSENTEAIYHSYQPQNIAPDSYWFRHRSTLPPPTSEDDTSRGSGNSYDGHQHHYGHPRSPGSSTVNDKLGFHPSHRYEPQPNPRQDDWTVTSSSMVQTDQFSPSYGKTQPQPTLPPARSADSIFGRTGSRRTFLPLPVKTTTYNGGGAYGNNSNNDNYHVIGGEGHHTHKINSDRKGRGDDRIFGGKWHSSLDSDLMHTGHSNVANTVLVKDREPSHLYIETAVFVDKDLYEHMQANFPDDTQAEVSRIVLAMINAVQLLYQDPSLGHRVEFVLKRLEILSTDPAGLLRPYDIDRFLTSFCKWQKTENPSSDADPLHWDHALILTGLDLYVVHQSGKISNQVVGLAPVAGMCTRSSSCTVNEGRHFESVYVMAHEIGHNLGMRHDGPQADNECDPTAHIMSPTLGSGKITWSPCSKRYLDMFLETSQSKCLLDKAKSETRLDHDADQRFPGERFNADQQCVLKYGRGSYHATQQPIEDICRDLHCRKQYYTWTSHPALEGTECGLEMSCRTGRCLPRSQLNEGGNLPVVSTEIIDPGISLSNHVGMDSSETAAYSTLKALNGAWGNWSPYTDCSSACLVGDEAKAGHQSSMGIRLAARRCDSPRPENGGRQCPGLDRRYKTCAPEKICQPNGPMTTISQYANEVCARAATVDTELSGRGFMTTTTTDPERACSVWCEMGQEMGSRSRGWSFPDGTACRVNSSPLGSHFCVAGKCQEFTCDTSSHFALSDEVCLHSAAGSRVSPYIHEGSWFGSDRNSPLTHKNRQEKSLWTKWESQSSCKLTCLAPGKGLELVQRKCTGEDEDGTHRIPKCTGLGLSVRLCKPDKSAILSNGCSRFQTVFEHASKLCTKYSEKVAGLSGIGMQLSPTKDDNHRACRIGCQDASLPYRFYMVNGEEGWFPAGTDCSRGDTQRKAYCLSGKCIDFGPDDTPLYRIDSKVFGKLESILRTKRSSDDLLVLSNTMMDQGNLRELIEKFAFGNDEESQSTNENTHSQDSSMIDFSRPILLNDVDHYLNLAQSDLEDSSISQGQNAYSYDDIDVIHSHKQFPFVEGSFYEWRKVMSDCSVSCGNGVQEVVVHCVSGDNVLEDSFCSDLKKPGNSGYIECQNQPCPLNVKTSKAHHSDISDNVLWKWIQSLMRPNSGHREI